VISQLLTTFVDDVDGKMMSTDNRRLSLGDDSRHSALCAV